MSAVNNIKKYNYRYDVDKYVVDNYHDSYENLANYLETFGYKLWIKTKHSIYSNDFKGWCRSIAIVKIQDNRHRKINSIL